MTRNHALTLLGLSGNPHVATIRHAYRQLVKKCRPGSPQYSIDEFEQLNEAFLMLIMQTSESEAHETYLFVENDDQPIPKPETYPEANEEELHWLLHPIAKIRNAYTAYYVSPIYRYDQNYAIVANTLNSVGILTLIGTIYLIFKTIYPDEYIKPFIALSGIFLAYGMNNYAWIRKFRWSIFKENFLTFLLESIVFRFGFMTIQMIWCYYAMTLLLYPHNWIWGLALLLSVVIQIGFSWWLYRLPMSPFISIGAAFLTINSLFFVNSLYSSNSRTEILEFTYYTEKVMRRDGPAYHLTPLIDFQNDDYNDAYLVRFRPWDDKKYNKNIELKISDGFLGIEYIDSFEYKDKITGAP